MKVLYILDPVTYGGATRSAQGMIMQLKEKGVVPIVCTAHYSKLNVFFHAYGIQTIVTGHREMITVKHTGKGALWKNFRMALNCLKRDIKAIRKISSEINMSSVDLIHTNSSRSDLGFFLGFFFRIPHVCHLREYGDKDYDVYPLNPFYILFYNRMAKKFICVSEAIRMHWVQKGIKYNKTILVYNGVDADKISVSTDDVKKQLPLKLVMSGGIMPTKGQHLVVAAIGMLPDDVKKNIVFDCVGWGPEDYQTLLKEEAKRVGVLERINFLGTRDDVLTLLGNYHVGLVCSRYEGFGRVTAEFMLAKLGVIVSDTGANVELIENEKTGLVFSSGDAESLSKAILRFYYDRAFLTQCSLEAREVALQRFTTEKNAQSIYEVYHEVVSIG